MSRTLQLNSVMNCPLNSHCQRNAHFPLPTANICIDHHQSCQLTHVNTLTGIVVSALLWDNLFTYPPISIDLYGRGDLPCWCTNNWDSAGGMSPPHSYTSISQLWLSKISFPSQYNITSQTPWWQSKPNMKTTNQIQVTISRSALGLMK